MSFKRRSLYCIDIPMQYVLQVAWTDAVGGLFHKLQVSPIIWNELKSDKDIIFPEVEWEKTFNLPFTKKNK